MPEVNKLRYCETILSVSLKLAYTHQNGTFNMLIKGLPFYTAPLETKKESCLRLSLSFKLNRYSLNYYSSDNAVCGIWLACASIADDVCDKICCLVNWAVSLAKSTS